MIMNKKRISGCVIGFMLFVPVFVGQSGAEVTSVGGSAPMEVAVAGAPAPMADKAGGSAATAVSKPEVIAAADFAIKAEEKVLKQGKGAQSAKLKLVEILSAEEQVVAGTNYKLKLLVKVNGKKKNAEAVVWEQAWNKKTPYQLTSWNWQ
jgi:hypothetical protein